MDSSGSCEIEVSLTHDGPKYKVREKNPTAEFGTAKEVIEYCFSKGITKVQILNEHRKVIGTWHKE